MNERLYCFGAWDEPEKALAEWNRLKHPIRDTGEKKRDDALTLKRLADAFLAAKKRKGDSGRCDHYVVFQSTRVSHYG